MNMKYIFTLASAGLFLLSSCLQEDFQQSQNTDGTLTVNFSRAGMINETALILTFRYIPSMLTALRTEC